MNILDNIVSVSISQGADRLDRRDFNILNVVEIKNNAASGAEKIKFYASLDEVVTDWASTTDVYNAAQTYFAQSDTAKTLAVSIWDKQNETLTEALTDIQDTNPNWYGLMFTKTVRDLVKGNSEVTPYVQQAAAWAQVNDKLFGSTTNSVDTLDNTKITDIASILQALSYSRTFLVYSSTPEEYPEAAVFGHAFSVDFLRENSTITLNFKRLRGLSPEKLKVSQLATLHKKRANQYYTIGNVSDSVSIFGVGVMCSDFFIDELHGIDWLRNALQNRVFNYLSTRVTSVPLTDKGGAAIEQQIIRTFDEAVNNGLISSGTTREGEFLPNGYITQVTPVSEIPLNQKLNRVGPRVTFTALLSGAVHSIQINGAVE